MRLTAILLLLLWVAPGQGAGERQETMKVHTDEAQITLQTPHLEAAIRKKGYVSGVAGGSLLDRKSGVHDLGFGLDIVDWLMEPGSDAAYRNQLPGDLPYVFNNAVHGAIPKRSVEGPQICTQAKEVQPQVIEGKDFIAVTMLHTYTLAAPGKKAGSTWEQTLLFPSDTRYFFACDRVTSVNASDALFLRTDLPGHIKHTQDDAFSEIYLSYLGYIPAARFTADFSPDAHYRYTRDDAKIPGRMIRAYRIKDPKTGAPGPWLAGMTLDPSMVYESWCHQRGYVCMIQEIGGRPIRAGESFGAAYIIGYFDSIAEMERVYDRYAGHRHIHADASGWRLE